MPIRTLGAFAVEREGAQAPASRKEGRKPLDLLKLLVALGGDSVPVTRLCASLWPDAAGDAARNSVDNTLRDGNECGPAADPPSRVSANLGARNLHRRVSAVSKNLTRCSAPSELRIRTLLTS